jgi:hypothetical protein
LSAKGGVFLRRAMKDLHNLAKKHTEERNDIRKSVRKL